ncbi:transposase [Streptosporangiaceae bacterium NEAU-GS5]|nr:transposase [Streptosporangiaceae bacterium NEAU-GS5]
MLTPARFVYADAGFAGALVEWAQRILRTTLHIVRKAQGQVGFAVIARRWVVERSLAWLTSRRRLARDYERHTAMSEAMIRWAAISGMARRLTRGQATTRQQKLRLSSRLSESATAASVGTCGARGRACGARSRNSTTMGSDRLPPPHAIPRSLPKRLRRR